MKYVVSLDADRYSGLSVNIAHEYEVGEVELLNVLEEMAMMAMMAAVETFTNPVKQLTITVSRI